MEVDSILTQSPVEVVNSSTPQPQTGTIDTIASLPAEPKRKKTIKSFKDFCKDTRREHDEQIVVRCSKSLKRQLHEDAVKKNKKMADIVRGACREYLEKKSQGGDRS